MTWGCHPIFRKLDVWGYFITSVFGVLCSSLNSYINRLLTPYASVLSALDVVVSIVAFLQVTSGVYLGICYVPEFEIVAAARDAVSNGTWFGTELYYIHAGATDLLFALSYLLLFKGVYFKEYVTAGISAWVAGVYAFFWLHYITVTSAVADATYVGDLLFTAIVNVCWSFFDEFCGVPGVVSASEYLSPNKLSVLLFLNILVPWYYLYLVQLRIFYKRKHQEELDKLNNVERKNHIDSYISWFYDALLKEFHDVWFWLITLSACCVVNYRLLFACLAVTEGWFFSGADQLQLGSANLQWYFKPFLTIIILSNSGVEGLAWVCAFFILLSLVPFLHRLYNQREDKLVLSTSHSPVQMLAFGMFVCAIFYITAVSPIDSFYNSSYGRAFIEFDASLFADACLYVLIYLGWAMHNFDYFDRVFFKFYASIVNKCAGVTNFGEKLYRSVLVRSLKQCARVLDRATRFLLFKKK